MNFFYIAIFLVTVRCLLAALERGQEELILRSDDYELVAQSFYIQVFNRIIQVAMLVLTKTELFATLKRT